MEVSLHFFSVCSPKNHEEDPPPRIFLVKAPPLTLVLSAISFPFDRDTHLSSLPRRSFFFSFFAVFLFISSPTESILLGLLYQLPTSSTISSSPPNAEVLFNNHTASHLLLFILFLHLLLFSTRCSIALYIVGTVDSRKLAAGLLEFVGHVNVDQLQDTCDIDGGALFLDESSNRKCQDLNWLPGKRASKFCKPTTPCLTPILLFEMFQMMRAYAIMEVGQGRYQEEIAGHRRYGERFFEIPRSQTLISNDRDLKRHRNGCRRIDTRLQ